MLRTGDIAKFFLIDGNKSFSSVEKETYTGIIVKCFRPSNDGEITYEVMCDDRKIRLFLDHEVIDHISLIGSYDNHKKI